MIGRISGLLLVLASLSFAITVVSPIDVGVQENDTLDLGTIGPGQTVSVLVDPIVTTGGIHGIGGTYDLAVAEDLPRRWKSQPSKLYQNPLQVTITADPDAEPGNYTARIKVIDEYNGEELGNVTFNVKVRVTYDVMDFDVSPEHRVAGPGQPARFKITILNKASTGDVFQVSAEGARKWEFKKPVFVPAKTSKTIYYEIVGSEEEEYRSTVKVISLASDKIYDEKNVSVSVQSNLFGDYKATNNGVIIFPIFELSIHSLAGLISNLLN
ncbi:hypothetical protein GF318_01245 [Candidatus Micrarchaeota archaeon]|nr:hypothetical protein [Candidatus Micrarchaeota archaeon]